MISDEEMLEIFPHPSVREVALELGFTPRLRIASEAWRIQDLLAESYPAVSEKVQAQDRGGLLQAYLFANPEEGRSIEVSQQSFAVTFNRYGSFEEFKDEALRRTELFADKFGVQSFLRSGLRYVNQIDLAPAQGVRELARYVKLPMDFERFDPEEIEEFKTEFRLDLQEHKMTIRNQLLRPPGKDRRLFILDLDCHTLARVELDELPHLMDRFHRHIQIQFLEHIREEYKQVMRGQDVKPCLQESDGAAFTICASSGQEKMDGTGKA